MRNIDVNDVIDNATFNKFHWKVLFWCTLIIVFDGYDLVIYGVVLPILMDQWDLNPYVAGLLGSSALFGHALLSLAFSRALTFECCSRFGTRLVGFASSFFVGSCL